MGAKLAMKPGLESAVGAIGVFALQKAQGMRYRLEHSETL